MPSLRSGSAYALGALASVLIVAACGPSAATPAGPAWPGPDNTGVPRGTRLAASGAITITKPGTVVDARDVAGSIEVMPGADHVTIKRTRVRSGDRWPIQVHDGVIGTLLEDVEVDGLDTPGQQAAIGYFGLTARRVNLHHTTEGVRLGTGVTVVDSWVHDVCSACGDGHAQAIGHFGGEHNRVLHNRLSNPHQATAVVFIQGEQAPVRDDVVEGNLLDGGGYTVYSVSGRSGVPVDVTFRDNGFSRTYIYGVRSLEGRPVWSGNFWSDTRQRIA